MTDTMTKTATTAEMTLNRHCPLVKCGQEVLRGERIATANRPGRGDIHAPLAGTITHVDPFRIRITPSEGGSEEQVNLKGLNGVALLKRLNELGVDLPIHDHMDTLIINGVDAELGVVTRQALLADHRETLEAGINAIGEAYTPISATLAVLKGNSVELGGLSTTVISEQYPAGLDPLVAQAVSGLEAPDSTVVIGLETVFHAGRVMETGLPVMETMVTVDETGRVVPLGTPVAKVLDEAGETFQERDRIILGGILRGRAASSPQQGVDRDTTAVSVVSNPAPVAMDAACVGCGECVRRCPARLDPAMITSYAEFGMYDKAADEHIEACFECGLCGFFCIAQRPMLQYIRLAKNELALAKARSGEENPS